MSSSIRYLSSHRTLLLRVSWRDLKRRYAGSLLGVAWAFLAPLLLMGLYAVVYLVIFKIRVPNLSPEQYVLYMFAGLFPFLMTTEAISTGVSSLSANKELLLNTVFPIDLLAPRVVIVSQATMVSGMAVTVAATLVLLGFHWTLLLVPVLWVLHLLCLTGVTWLISLAGVALPDFKNLVPVVMMALLIISPFAYSPGMVPEPLRVLIYLNPLAYFVIAYQHIVVLGVLPEAWTVGMIVVVSGAAFFGGGWIFSSVKRAISDYV